MKVLLYEQPFGRSLSVIHAYELWQEMSRLGVEPIWLTEEPRLPETVARVTPRLAGPPPGLRWANPRSVYRHYRFKASKIQPWRSLATLYQVYHGEQTLKRLATLYPKPDIVYRRHNYLNSEVPYAHSLGVPVVTEVNGIIEDEAHLAWWASSLSTRIVAKWEHSHFGQADHYIVVSEHLKQVLCERFNVPDSKITTVLNGVNTNRFRPMDPLVAKRQLGLNPSADYILFAGTMHPWQGVEHLIDALPAVRAKFPLVHLIVAGSGLKQGHLEKYVSTHGITGVTFTNQIPHSEVPLYMGASSICTMPYITERVYKIGISPLKMCEYLACERPIVASRVRGLECLEKEDCGVLIPPANSQAVAEAAIALLSNRHRMKEMGQNGRRYVAAHRSWKAAAEKTLAVCQNTIEEYKRA